MTKTDTHNMLSGLIKYIGFNTRKEFLCGNGSVYGFSQTNLISECDINGTELFGL